VGRVLVLLALLFAAASGAAWLADQPGTIRYAWRGVEGSLSTAEAAALAAGAAIVLLVVAEVVRTLWRLPRTLGERRERARSERGVEALSAGLVAVGAGDTRTASRAARKALAALPDAPLATFLAAQAAQMRGDGAQARAHFEALAARPETATLGLRGLALEAQRAGEPTAALAHARAALSLDPGTPWAAETVFAAAAAAGDFDAALQQLERNARARLVERKAYRRLRAVLLTAKARALPPGEEASASAAALEAHQLARDFVPAALAAAKAVATRNRRQATAVLEDTYRRAPHPDLFRAALDLEPVGAQPRLKRARAFAALRPDHVESAIGLARAALSARDAATAREALAPHLDSRASQRVCILMAELEALAPGDEGRVRDWLARAVRAPRDPQWVADGVIAADWAPVSPVTGRLDAFEWRVPPSVGEPVPAVDLAFAPAEADAIEHGDAPRVPGPPALRQAPGA